LHLWPFSWAIAHSFGVPGWFTRPMTLCTCERHDKKCIIFAFMAVFMSYCPQFWCSRLIYKVHDTLYMFERHDKKTHCFCVYGCFHKLLPTVLGFQADLQGPWQLVHFLEGSQKTRHFCILGPF
jgi:hypothetical protein